MLFGLVSCEDDTQQNHSIPSESTSEPSSTVVEPESYSISLVGTYENYVHEIKAGCEKAVEDLKKQNVDINFSFDPTNHSTDAMVWKYEEIIKDNSIPKDSIIFVPRGTSGYEEAFETANKKGIKTVLLDTITESDCWDAAYTPNYYNEGEIAAQEMIKRLKDEGVYSGKICLIGVNKSTEITCQREEGFRSVFEKRGRAYGFS